MPREMPDILFIATPAPSSNDNHERIPRAFRRAGWQVTLSTHEDICFDGANVVHAGRRLDTYTQIWCIGFGPRATYADRVALLAQLEQAIFINPVRAVDHMHAKTAWLDMCPLTCVSSRAQVLTQFAASHGGEWVLKPNAGSYGRLVFHVRQAGEIAGLTGRHPPSMWLLQRFLPDIRRGEVRVLGFRRRDSGRLLAQARNRISRQSQRCRHGAQAEPGRNVCLVRYSRRAKGHASIARGTRPFCGH